MATKVVSQSILDAFARVLGLLDQTRDELDTTIGQLGALTTVEKTDVVGAVNEVNETSVSKLAKDQVTFDLSYQLLVPTNKGCVVEGGYLPVYQLVDPKFDFAASGNYSVNGGAVTVEQVINTVNARGGEVRHPKPTDFEVSPNSTNVAVNYSPATRKVTVTVPKPASGSTTYTLRMKGGANSIRITSSAAVMVTPRMYANWLSIITNGYGNDGATENTQEHMYSNRLPGSYGLDIFTNDRYSNTMATYDFSNLDRVEIVIKYPTTQKDSDRVYNTVELVGEKRPTRSIFDIRDEFVDVAVNPANREMVFTLRFDIHQSLKKRTGAHLLAIDGPNGTITNQMSRLTVYDKSGGSHTVTLPKPEFGQTITTLPD